MSSKLSLLLSFIGAVDSYHWRTYYSLPKLTRYIIFFPHSSFCILDAWKQEGQCLSFSLFHLSQEGWFWRGGVVHPHSHERSLFIHFSKRFLSSQERVYRFLICLRLYGNFPLILESNIIFFSTLKFLSGSIYPWLSNDHFPYASK